MMEEKDILLRTIEAQNATMESLSATIKEQAERIKELTAQVAYLNRQLFGRKAEKLPIYDPSYPDLFAGQFADLMQQAEEKRDEAVAEIEKNTKAERKQKKQNRIMMEDLPVLERSASSGHPNPPCFQKPSGHYHACSGYNSQFAHW